MGLLKKITRPISKVLDKLIPNEIKPALPYLAAFAPYMMGPGAGGIFKGIGINNPMLQRALMSGTLNLGSQLSQEGSEGEFSGLSALLAGAQGALTAPGAAESLTGMTTKGTLANQGIIGSEARMELANRGLLTKAKDFGLEGLTTGAKFLEKGVDVLGPGKPEVGLDLATLEAAALPVSQATGDLAYADAQRALRDYEDQMAADESTSLIDDDGRRRAIRAAMEASNHLESTILDTLAALGLKQGGIVGMKKGGILNAKRGLVDGPGGYAGKRDAKNISTEELIEIVQAGRSTPEILIELELRMPGAVEQIKMEMIGGKEVEEGSQIFNVDEEALSKYDFLKPDVQQSFLYKLRESNPDIYGEYKRPVDTRGVMADGGVASVLPKGREADYRGGGVIPVGSRERADDVPARLSKNEFVMTADAVRAAGGGSINKGAKRMYNLMHNLEARV